jgi:glutamine amidotransferase-like uncharacterized protein
VRREKCGDYWGICEAAMWTGCKADFVKGDFNSLVIDKEPIQVVNSDSVDEVVYNSFLGNWSEDFKPEMIVVFSDNQYFNGGVRGSDSVCNMPI